MRSVGTNTVRKTFLIIRPPFSSSLSFLFPFLFFPFFLFFSFLSFFFFPISFLSYFFSGNQI